MYIAFIFLLLPTNYYTKHLFVFNQIYDCSFFIYIRIIEVFSLWYLYLIDFIKTPPRKVTQMSIDFFVAFQQV